MVDVFRQSLGWSNQEIKPLIYFLRKRAKEGQAIDIRGDGKYATHVQREDHVDVIAASFMHFFEETISFEVKIRSKRYADKDDLLTETRSCTKPGYESKGWIYTCKADLLGYINILNIHLRRVRIVKMPDYQEWFYQLEQAGKLREYKPVYTTQSNRTESYPIPWESIPQDFILYDGVIYNDGSEAWCTVHRIPKKKRITSLIPINRSLWEELL